MAKIFYSLSGEGRGHSTRVRAVVDELRKDHEIVVYAPGAGYDFLKPLYDQTDVQVRPLEGIQFHYMHDRLNLSRTVRGALKYFRGLPGLAQGLRNDMLREQPDLAITDFEPALPWAARQCRVPLVSLNHQHFLLTYDLRSLPGRLRWHAFYMSGIVRAYCTGQTETIVSSFYFPPLRRGSRKVTQTGVMLRSSIRSAAPAHGSHLVAYCRRFASPNLLAALADTGRDVHVYGLGHRSSAGRLSFHGIHESHFLEDLASCSALIATAGNQLIGEALYLGKPAFVLPEARNYEQYINAHFLKQSGAGDWAEMRRVHAADLRRFVDRLEFYRARIDPYRLDGLPVAMHVLRRSLPALVPKAVHPKLSVPLTPHMAAS